MRGFLAIVILLLSASGGFAQSLLTVQGGYGGGNYFPGDTRFIAARTPGVGEVFKRWRFTSANGAAIDPGAWLQALSMPAEPLILRAEFQVLAPYQVQSLNINGSQARYAAPSGTAHSLLLRFHGTGGSAQNLFNPGENLYFAELALSRGFVVASLDSVNRVDRQWNASFNLSNPDVQNVAALIAELRTRGVITQQIRIVGQGTSNGGGFVTRVSALLAFDAQAIVIASGINPIVRAAQIPTCWVLNRNDSNSGVGAQAILDATASAATLSSQGVRNQLWILEASPVYPERFTRVRALTVADSRAVYELLRSQNALDSNDFLIVHPDTLSGLALPAPASAHASEIADQLKIAYAEHHFSSNFMHLQLDFLEGRVFAQGFE